MPAILAALLLGAVAPPPPDDDDDKAQPTAAAPDLDDDAPKAASARRSPDADDADDDEDEGKQPNSPIVVVARQLDVARTRVDSGLGATVYELHNETIETRPGGETGSVGAILQQTPGVTLSNATVTVRGSSAVQVRINGVIVPEAIADPADRLSSRLAESTRLITGTLPAQFGFAPGGVIAVTTKNGLYQHGGEGELFAGNHGAFEPAFEWGGSTGGSSLFASGSLESGNSRVADAAGPSARDVRHEIGGLAFADHVIGPADRVSLILGGSRERDKIGATDLPAGIEQTGNAYAVGTLQHSVEGFTIQASLFGAHAADEADFAHTERERRGSFGTQVDSSLAVGGGHTLRAGLLLTRSDSRETASPSAHRTSLGVYLGDEWKPDDQFTINAGLRGDWLRSLSSVAAVEPRGSIVWQSGGGLSLHAGYARYAAAPPLGEEPPGARLPSERDDYFDAGAQQKLGPVTLGIDGYLRSVRNLIAERQVPGEVAPTAFDYARGRFRGIEFSATFAQGPVNAWANLALARSRGLTIVDGAGLFPAASLAAADAGWVPLASDRPVSGSAGVAWRLGELSLSGDVLAGSGAVRTADAAHPNGARSPAFASFGASAVYHLKLAGRPLDVRADLTNLTDVRYLTNDASALEGGWTRWAQGRAFLIGIEQGF